MFRRQQSGGGQMIWAGIIDNTIVGHIRVPIGVKLTSKMYHELLESVLLPWFEDLPLSSRRKVIFIHDNAPSHSAKLLQATWLIWLLWTNHWWTAQSLRPIWTLHRKWLVHLETRNIHQLTSIFLKDRVIWNVLNDAAASVPPAQTDSIDHQPTLWRQMQQR